MDYYNIKGYITYTNEKDVYFSADLLVHFVFPKHC